MGFQVNYCISRLCYIGKCSLYPLYESTGDTPEEAMGRIIRLASWLDHDDDTTDVDEEVELEDTVEVTNTSWPPFRKLHL